MTAREGTHRERGGVGEGAISPDAGASTPLLHEGQRTIWPARSSLIRNRRRQDGQSTEMDTGGLLALGCLATTADRGYR